MKYVALRLLSVNGVMVRPGEALHLPEARGAVLLKTGAVALAGKQSEGKVPDDKPKPKRERKQKPDLSSMQVEPESEMPPEGEPE